MRLFDVATKIGVLLQSGLVGQGYDMGMAARSGAMHVARNKRAYVAKSGERRVYESVLVRRTLPASR